MAPPQGQMKPGRQLAVLAGLFVVLYLLVFFTSGASGSFTDRLHPRLGLDLVGGMRMTLVAQGKTPSAKEMEQARQIIEDRVNGTGVAEAEVVTEGDKNIVVSIPGSKTADLEDVGQPAQMFFRKVLNSVQDNSGALAAATASPSPSASASTSASPSASASAKPSATASGQGGGAAASATPSASASTSPSAAASPTPTAKALTQEQTATLDEVKKKIGDTTYKAAEALTAPVDVSTDPTAALQFSKFADLTANEVAVLPAKIQFNVPQVGCEQLGKRPVGSISDANSQVVACESTGKYLLDVAKVAGTDIGSAQAVPPNGQQAEWVVSLKFKGNGQDKWTNLTKEAVNKTGTTCEIKGDQGNCLVAVVLDNEVISAPEIREVLTSDSTISGSFTSDTASDLANKLNYGALPVTFKADEAVHVTATLGQAQLKAGLLAAGLGMLLVIVYAFFYYRLLGSVIFLSLVLSGLLTFGALVWLGRTMGFTLTLAGMAGFVVSLGVAADSFVIYFERLKDEIREGRAPRSAVQRAWVRARRTIITANTVTVMAAVVLYLFSAGAVKGFAFALGLSTVLDLVVVFLFRHPMMEMFARTKAFMSPRVSGLGRVLHQANEDEADEPRRYRAKEA
ncbi:protein translocase subunit SecD [Hamadaea flava]|uniref:Protein translocase subunit SecD n=1 Tax=Hamadaea flava TaxID=1742688 RepID=A0ABV8LRS8_9ACTN|nr:protein translocase subunit SecD [Hamadaea flava]